MERLQKYMAHCGVASRRKCEELIESGQVRVNGEVVTELGVKVDPNRDTVKVGRRILRPQHKVYYLLHKPKNCTVTASDELGRRTVLDVVKDIKERVYPVGRLDRDSEGLLILTNDGDLAHYLTHPAFGVRKVYRATVEGHLEAGALQDLVKKGVRLGGALVKPLAAKLIKSLRETTIVEITVGEGINREVRRVFAAMGHEVKRLVRIQEGPLTLRGLGKGNYRPLTKGELQKLQKGMERVDLSTAAESGPPRRTRTFAGQKRTGKPDPAARSPRKPAGPKRKGAAAKQGDKAASAPKPAQKKAKKKAPARPAAAHPLAKKKKKRNG